MNLPIVLVIVLIMVALAVLAFYTFRNKKTEELLTTGMRVGFRQLDGQVVDSPNKFDTGTVPVEDVFGFTGLIFKSGDEERLTRDMDVGDWFHQLPTMNNEDETANLGDVYNAIYKIDGDKRYIFGCYMTPNIGFKHEDVVVHKSSIDQTPIVLEINGTTKNGKGEKISFFIVRGCDEIIPTKSVPTVGEFDLNMERTEQIISILANKQNKSVMMACIRDSFKHISQTVEKFKNLTMGKNDTITDVTNPNNLHKFIVMNRGRIIKEPDVMASRLRDLPKNDIYLTNGIVEIDLGEPEMNYEVKMAINNNYFKGTKRFNNKNVEKNKKSKLTPNVTFNEEKNTINTPLPVVNDRSGSVTNLAIPQDTIETTIEFSPDSKKKNKK